MQDIALVLRRRLPAVTPEERERLAEAYTRGVMSHAKSRTVGAAPAPTTLAAERADLLAHVSRHFGRVLSADEVAALLRVPPVAAQALCRMLLDVYDDVPPLDLRTEEARSAPAEDHGLADLDFEPSTKRFSVTCHCGWRSERLSSAGLAQSALDLHVEEVTPVLRVYDSAPPHGD